MKKLLIVLAVLVLFVLCSCNSNKPTTPTPSPDPTPTVVTGDPTPEVTPTPAVTPTPTPEVTPTPVVTPTPEVTPTPTVTPFSLVDSTGTALVADENGNYNITAAGEYTASGNLSGMIACASTLAEKVTLNLNGVTITNTTKAIYWASESSKIEIKAKENTVNTITVTGEGDASAIESENNLELGGKGTLKITCSQKHAVKASEITVGGSVTLELEAASDGLHGKAITVATNGTIKVKNSSDAFQAEVNSKGKKGTIEVTSGTIIVESCATVFKYDKSLTVKAAVDDAGATATLVVTVTNTTAFTSTTDGTTAITVVSGQITIDGTDYTTLE